LEFERKDDYGTIEDDIGRTELQRQAEEKKKQYVHYSQTCLNRTPFELTDFFRGLIYTGSNCIDI
jgi:hypothetical protein